MKVIISGDWHLGLVVGGYDTHDDIVKAAKVVVEATHLADLFVFGGDLFHYPRPEPREYATAINLLDSVGCPFVIIPGNHDAGKVGFTRIASGRPVPKPDALEPLRKIRWRVDAQILELPTLMELATGEVFLFAGHVSDAKARYETRERLEGELSAQGMIDEIFSEALRMKKLDGAFCHLDLAGARPGSEGAFLAGGKLEMPINLARKFSCVVVNSHIHKRQTFKENVLLPGSIIPTDFADIDGAKGYLELEV